MTKEQKAQYHKEYWAKNREFRRQQKRQLYAKNREAILAKVKQYSVNNRETILAYRKEHYIKNRGIIRGRVKQYRAKNREAISERAKQRYAKDRDANRDVRLEKARRNHAKNRAARNKTRRQWISNHPQFLKDPRRRIINNLSRRVRNVLDGSKSASTMKLVGCDIDWLKAWFEIQFKPLMTWENYGPAWHIDHIKPCAKFDLTDPDQQKLCFHFTNLQPMWASDNSSKGAKWEETALSSDLPMSVPGAM
jgi:hypothetical protein